MKANVMIETEIEISGIELNVAVRYDEDDMPNDFPHRKGDMWNPVINIDTGQIGQWDNTFGRCKLYMKVCDEGTYTLLNSTGGTIAEIANNYVPHGVVPGEYGDYIEFDIDLFGVITNWPKNPDVSEFFANDD